MITKNLKYVMFEWDPDKKEMSIMGRGLGEGISLSKVNLLSLVRFALRVTTKNAKHHK
jgi:hypothetical protein